MDAKYMLKKRIKKDPSFEFYDVSNDPSMRKDFFSQFF